MAEERSETLPEEWQRAREEAEGVGAEIEEARSESVATLAEDVRGLTGGTHRACGGMFIGA